MTITKHAVAHARKWNAEADRYLADRDELVIAIDRVCRDAEVLGGDGRRVDVQVNRDAWDALRALLDDYQR